MRNPTEAISTPRPGTGRRNADGSWTFTRVDGSVFKTDDPRAGAREVLEHAHRYFVAATN